MDSEKTLPLPSKKFVYFGLIICIISLIFSIFPFFVPWDWRQYQDIYPSRYTNVTSTFYMSYEYNEIEIYNKTDSGTHFFSLNNTVYYSKNTTLELCNKTVSCSDKSNFQMAKNFNIGWLVVVFFFICCIIYRLKEFDSEISPMK